MTPLALMFLGWSIALSALLWTSYASWKGTEAKLIEQKDMAEADAYSKEQTIRQQQSLLCTLQKEKLEANSDLAELETRLAHCRDERDKLLETVASIKALSSVGIASSPQDATNPPTDRGNGKLLCLACGSSLL